ncbi:MAG: exosome complex RNA-binding protein Rrp4 [Nanoarchaeota archaeon]
MSELKIENKQVVVPGQVLAEGMGFLPGVGAYRAGESIIANKVGLVSIEGRALKLIPLSGRYMPKAGDVIIAQVIDVLLSGWRLDTNSAYSAMLPIKDATEDFIDKDEDLTELLSLNEYVVTKITRVTSQKLIDLTLRAPGLGKVSEGQILYVNSHKVPRIIGKQGSMVSMIKKVTGCNIIVGQNGVIWVSGSPQGEVLAVKTIRLIEKMTHISGLTDLIKAFLQKETQGKDFPDTSNSDVMPMRRSGSGGSERGDRRPRGRGFNKSRKFKGPRRGDRK